MNVTISDTIKYIGVDDTDLDLFESQYVIPQGVSYNSYIILDDKTCLMDTVDARKTDEWEKKLLAELGDRNLDYLVIQHLEPDHAGSIGRILEKFPNVTLVGNVKTFTMLPQFFDKDISNYQRLEVKEGDVLSLGQHSLTFVLAPMVHWPEVMVSYESNEKILFAADGFGKFGALCLTEDDDWACEARRYYFNIVGKYGNPVQQLLKKAAGLDIQMICPLHGPILHENLGYYIDLYDTWSSYKPEKSGVFIVCASIHGNTKKAAYKLKEMLEQSGVHVAFSDITRDDVAEAVEDAFKYDRMLLCAASYDGGVFAPMENFLHHLKTKAYQNRTVAILENGSWGPTAARTIKSILEGSKNLTFIDPVVTIRSTMKSSDISAMEELVKALTNI